MEKPDWTFWRHVPEIELWQAVCLSLNIDPDEYDSEDSVCDEFFGDNKTASRRLRQLVANLVPRGWFSRFIIDYEDPHLSKVRLSEFAAWADSAVEWEGLPPELVALARPLPRREEAHAPQIPDEVPEQPAPSGATEKAAPEGAPDDAAEGDAITPAERRANHDMTTERGVRLAILEAWGEIEKCYGPTADGRQVLRVLNRLKDEDQKPLVLKTVRNRLIDLRKQKLIPG